MTSINSRLIPSFTPGTIFSELTTNTNFNIRWLTALDPVLYAVYNRPLADLTVRQLIIAKSLDRIELAVGNASLFPFLIQPKLVVGTSSIDLPPNWIWDIQASMPGKWEDLRLAKIIRISGSNPTTGTDGTGTGPTTDYTGKLRLIFTASLENSTTEFSVFYADYVINSTLTFQISRLLVPTVNIDADAVDQSEASTFAGSIVIRTLNVTDAIVQSFYDSVVTTNTTDSNSDGFYDNPDIYEIADSNAGSTATDDFDATIVSHGTGILTSSACNSIPSLDSSIQYWIEATNYPYNASANRTSTEGIEIPLGLFREFSIIAPAGDLATGDTSNDSYPVYISKISVVGTGEDVVRFTFSTYATGTQVATEFAFLDLPRSGSAGDVIKIEPLNSLLVDNSDFIQDFGRGHATLSVLWSENLPVINAFFDSFAAFTTDPRETTFTPSSTRVSSFGINRVSKYTPTKGMFEALYGTTSDYGTPEYPSSTNKFVTENDQGAGEVVDLEAQTGVTPNSAISKYGYSGSLCHKLVKLEIDYTSDMTSSSFYDDEILPRLKILFGRDLVFGDQWYDGSRFKTWNGSTWLS